MSCRMSRNARVIAGLCLLSMSGMAHAEPMELSGKVTWGQRAICERYQGRKLVFSGEHGRAEAAIEQGGRYSVSLEPGRYRVTLRCGGTDIKSLDVITYPTPTHQNLSF